MTEMSRLMGWLVRVGFALAAAGLLVTVCLELKKSAIEANQTGLISLRAWNNALQRSIKTPTR